MGNEISSPATDATAITSNATRKFALPIEILFEVLAFVKFHEAPNIFLVNRYLLPICQIYFHSGTVGQNKYRKVRDLTMQLKDGSFTISVERNGTLQSVPVPEVDPPKILNAFGHIEVKKCCRIEAIKFLNKYQSLLNKEKNEIICARDFFGNTAIANESDQKINSNLRSSVVDDEKQFFLNWIGQKELWFVLKSDYLSKGVARCLVDEPLIARFHGCLFMSFNNERNLCGLEEDAKLIYGWISSPGKKQLEIYYYDAQKAMDMACQIALLFAEAHADKKEAKNMDLLILLPKDSVVPMHMQKVCNGIGEQLATLRTLSAKCSDGIYAAYVFHTKSIEYYNENKEELLELPYREAINFL